MNKAKLGGLFLAVFLILAQPCAADEGPASEPTSKISRWDLRLGYSFQYTNTSRPNNFQLIHAMPSFVMPLGRHCGPGFLRGRFEWNPEILLAEFIHPYDRTMVGITPIQFHWAFDTGDSPFRPYLTGGTGILHANVSRRETRSDINFNTQGGIGAYWDFNQDASLIFEYRHIHISNAGLHEDNSGINTHTFLAGVSLKK